MNHTMRQVLFFSLKNNIYKQCRLLQSYLILTKALAYMRKKETQNQP